MAGACGRFRKYALFACNALYILALNSTNADIDKLHRPLSAHPPTPLSSYLTSSDLPDSFTSIGTAPPQKSGVMRFLCLHGAGTNSRVSMTTDGLRAKRRQRVSYHSYIVPLQTFLITLFSRSSNFRRVSKGGLYRSCGLDSAAFMLCHWPSLSRDR